MTNQNNNVKQEPADDFIRIQDLISLCLAKWKWFVVSLVVTMGIAILYLLMTPSVYLRSASILIKEDSKGQSISSDVASLFSDLGMSQSASNVNNELIAIQSPAVILETIKRLSLDVNYQVKGLFHKETLYASDLPVRISFPDLADNESVSLVIRLLPEQEVELSDIVRGKEDFSDETVKGKLNEEIETPAGKMIVRPNLNYEEFLKGDNPDIYVTRTNLYNMTDYVKKNLTASLGEEKATVINLSYKDVLTQRAEDVLNTLITVYKENWMNDKNQMTISTSMFITDRLGVIEHELGDVDQDISSYKSEHLLPDVEAASALYMTQSKETNNMILELNTRLSMARYIRNYLTSGSGRNQLLPVNSGIESSSIEAQISEYNMIQLQRNNLVANSSEQNPLVVDYDQSLASMRRAIISSIDNLVVTLNTQIANLQKNEKKTTEQIAANPNQAKYLMSVGRQQKVKEALYLFLLQKREENELSQAFTAYNTRLITPPYGSLQPVSPQKRNILMVAFVLGLLIPVVIVFIQENMNTKVRGRKDLENLSIPFAGEIPQYLSGKHKTGWSFGKEPSQTGTIVVKAGSRDVMNEAFRVLRTNIEFMSGKEQKSNVILFTSFNPGSGKTFLCMNIAASLAIKKKRVIVIDGDMRHASASTFVNSPREGLSDYLNGNVGNVRDVIVPYKEYDGFDILPVGTIPPNPTELLFTDKLSELVEELRGEYDYILIDCPPTEIVADTQIIEKVVDRTIFVVRAGLLERSMLPDLETLYRDRKYKNMAMILNGTISSGKRYGYRYGYHYGYASDYHSNNY